MEDIITNKGHHYKRNLPHYSVPGACYFVTFRLADSLPISRFEKIKNNYEINKSKIQASNIKSPLKQNKLDKNWKKYFYQIDKLMAKYRKSPTFLDNTKIANMVADSLKYHDLLDYDLLCYCIMPNHVHIIFTLLARKNLSDTMFSIKRYTAGQANKILNRKGHFWQHESYDHIIRNQKALDNIINYTINNPVDAGLVKNWKDWEWTYLTDIEIL